MVSQKSGVLALESGAGTGLIVFRAGLVHAAGIKGRSPDLRGLLVSAGLVETDGFDRPASVYALNFDPASHPCADYGTGSFPTLVFRSDDPTVHVDVQRTKGCDFVAIHARTQSSNEVHLIRHETDTLQLVRAWEHGVQYHVDVGGTDDLFVLAHRQSSGTRRRGQAEELGVELSLFQSSTSDLPLQESFGKCIAGSSSPYNSTAPPSYAVFDFDIFEDFVALYERSTMDGTHRIRVMNRHKKGDEWTVPPIPSDQHHHEVMSITPAGNMHHKSKSLRFHVECPYMPRKTLEYNMLTRQLLTIPDETPSSDVVQRRVLVPSKDGALVPLSLVYRDRREVVAAAATEEEEVVDTPVNVVLIGYGAYGEPVSLAYDPTLQPLLDRGHAVAYAHTRGGGELGRAWHHVD